MNCDDYANGRRSSPAFAIGGETEGAPPIMLIKAGDLEPYALKRATAEKCLAVVERVIAAQGEHAEPLLVKLQHEIVEQLREGDELTDEEEQRERLQQNPTVSNPLNS